MGINKYGYVAEVCEHCNQAKTYLLPIDWGTALIVKAFARAIRNKGINTIHPTKEMLVRNNEWTYQRALEEGVLTSNQIGNFTRARVHGLLARNKEHAGNWILTRKGAAFLRGERIPKLAIIEKSRKVEGGRSHKQDYYKPEEYTVDVHSITKKGYTEPWEGIDFEIVEGNIIQQL